MKTIIIAAIAENRVIGKKGVLPWHIPEDFQHFKNTTRGHAIIMGRKTLESMNNRPLPKRINIILSRNPNYTAEGCVVKTSLQEAIQHAQEQGAEKAFVIGGAAVYKEALAIADQMILSHVKGIYEGETLFPEWGNEWKVVEEKQHEQFTVKIYKNTDKE
jgi:dihydrofolate reductase